jgi:hypothetical protein
LPAQQEGTPIPGKFDKNKFGDLISRMKIPTIKIDYLKNAHLSMHALKDRISVPDIQVEWRELGSASYLPCSPSFSTSRSYSPSSHSYPS